MAAERVCRAIAKHANLCSRDSDNAPAIMPAVVDLQESLREYVRLVTEISGWADPVRGYNLPPEDDADETDEVGDPAGVEADVMVFDHYFLGVEDPQTFLEYASTRAGRPLDNLDAAADALCRLDGWKPEAYPGGVTVNTRNIDTCFS